MSHTTPDPRAIPLRQPAELVAPSAVGYWRFSALFRLVIVAGILGTARFVAIPVLFPGLAREITWLQQSTAIGVALLAVALVWSIFVPKLRYAIHRWELTDEALYTQSGWLTRTLRIAPLSRIQTVDTRQGILMRWFGLTTVVAANASSAGTISIACLANDTAQDLVARLTAITATSEGDGA